MSAAPGDDVPVFGAPPAGVTPVPRPGAYGVLRGPDGRLAVAYTARGIHLPGGGHDAGESDVACLCREAREELGIVPENLVEVTRCVQHAHSASSGVDYAKQCVILAGDVASVAGGGEPDHVLGWLTPECAWRNLRHAGMAWAVAETYRQPVRVALANGGAVRAMRHADATSWVALRNALWPAPPGEHEAEIAAFLGRGALRGLDAAFLAEAADGTPLGFAEASLRRLAEGATSERVAYLEGWYVAPDARRQGVGAALVEAVAAWGRGLACTELASDTEVENTRSAAAHRALGFEDRGAVHLFVRSLGAAPPGRDLA